MGNEPQTWTPEVGYIADGQETIVRTETSSGTPRLGAYSLIRPETARDLLAAGITHSVERVIVHNATTDEAPSC